MRRRRKTKYTWLPIDGQLITVGETNINSNYFTMSNTIGAGAGSALPSTVFSNILSDFPETDFDVSTVSLADEIGSEYFIKRIVGKCFQQFFVTTTSEFEIIDLNAIPPVMSTVGFFIAPASPDNIAVPIGIDGLEAQQYNPGNAAAIRQPWIWRRSWVYGGYGPRSLDGQNHVNGTARISQADKGSSGAVQISDAFPWNNAEYGSIQDGPHIDAKTARRVRLHERLWVACNMQLLPEGAVMDSQFAHVDIQTYFDLRVLGGLRKARNRSSFS